MSFSVTRPDCRDGQRKDCLRTLPCPPAFSGAAFLGLFLFLVFLGVQCLVLDARAASPDQPPADGTTSTSAQSEKAPERKNGRKKVSDNGRSRPALNSTSCPPDFSPTALKLTGFQPVCIGVPLQEIQRLQMYWDRIVQHHDPEAVYGPDSELYNPSVRAQWKNLSKLMPTLSPEKKLQYINGFFNSWPSESDLNNFGMEEYWASPEEFLEKGKGDCEDYAIIKYLALRYHSWPTEDMWVLLVMDNKTEEKHAVMVARAGDKTFILCNLSRPAYLLIPEKLYMQNFSPLFAVNDHGVWMFARSGTQPELQIVRGNKAAGPSAKKQ